MKWRHYSTRGNKSIFFYSFENFICIRTLYNDQRDIWKSLACNLHKNHVGVFHQAKFCDQLNQKILTDLTKLRYRSHLYPANIKLFLLLVPVRQLLKFFLKSN